MPQQAYRLEEVARHTKLDDCWIIIEGIVYDVTRYLDEHPGGRKIVMEQAGGDATEAFEENDHSDEAKDMLQDYQIGIVSHKTPLLQTLRERRTRILLALCGLLLALLLKKIYIYS